MAEKKAEGKRKEKKGGGKLGLFTFCILMGLLAPFMMPTVTLVLIGMIPTYVAFATDDDRQKSGAVSVGAMNFAEIVPFIIDLWSKGQTMSNAFRILSDPANLLVILGAAAVGHMIVYAIPQAIASLTLNQAELRIKGLRKNMENLKEAWGEDVATTKPIDKLIQG